MTPGERRQAETDRQMGQHERRMMERARFGSALAADLFEIASIQPVVPKPVQDVDFNAILGTLNNEQLDHLSVGLELNFGAVLSGNQGEPESYFLTLETGKLVALHASTLTVQDVWNTAEELTP